VELRVAGSVARSATAPAGSSYLGVSETLLLFVNTLRMLCSGHVTLNVDKAWIANQQAPLAGNRARAEPRQTHHEGQHSPWKRLPTTPPLN